MSPSQEPSLTVRVVQEPASALAEYARIPIAFEAGEVMEVATASLAEGVFVLSKRTLQAPILKDYDALPDGGPTRWATRFDLSRWAFFAAYADEARVGGAAVAMHSAEIDLLEERSDLALLWDIRVEPSARRSGVGSALMGAVESWALDRGASCLKVETQNINVAACRFYARQGFELRRANPHAYSEHPGETQFLWYKPLMRT